MNKLPYFFFFRLLSQSAAGPAPVVPPPGAHLGQRQFRGAPAQHDPEQRASARAPGRALLPVRPGVLPLPFAQRRGRPDQRQPPAGPVHLQEDQLPAAHPAAQGRGHQVLGARRRVRAALRLPGRPLRAARRRRGLRLGLVTHDGQRGGLGQLLRNVPAGPVRKEEREKDG